jgi:RHS repeat-associated protein
VFGLGSADTNPPVWNPGAILTESLADPSSFTVTWPTPSEDTEIVCYGLYLDGELLGSIAPGMNSAVIDGLLPGREYEVVVEACDAGGNCTDSGPLVRAHTELAQEPPRNPSLGIDYNDKPESLLLHSGEFVLTRTDLFVRGRRMHFRFQRTYRSGRDIETPLGHGWDAGIYMRLEAQANGDMLCFPGNGRSDLYVSQPDGGFESPAGFYTRLVTNVTGFTLRDRLGMKYNFDTSGRVSRCEDRIGNHLDYGYTNANGLVSHAIDEFGRRIDFLYDGQDRLETIRDFTGRECVFTYDADNNLVAARSPTVTGTPQGNDFPSGKTERYTYDTNQADPRLAHNLLEVIAPNEVADAGLTPRTINVYGQFGDNYDRVLAKTVGGTNGTFVAAGGTLAYVYDLLPSGGPSGTVSRTTVTDRAGNTTLYFHDAEGHCLRTVEEPQTLAITNEMTYNAHGEQISWARPLGNRAVSVYDEGNPDRFQQGNRLSFTRLPDAARGGGQAQIQTTYSYEPLFNQLLSGTGPRGNDATYVPQNGGVQSAARYTAEHRFDYMESSVIPQEAIDWGITIPGLLLGVGDVNGDGGTNQAMGNLVLEQRPTVTLLPGSNQALAEGDTSQDIVSRYQYNAFGQLNRIEDSRGNVHLFTFNPENDPDGDMLDIIAGRDASDGGYASMAVADAVIGPNRQDPGPAIVISNLYAYDPRGNAIEFTDGRGFIYKTVFNELDQVVETEAPKVDAGQTRGYRVQTSYDANDNVVTSAIENVTTDPATHLPVAGTPGFFVHSSRYDILDNPIEHRRDATRDPAIPPSGEPEILVTHTRYDANENVEKILSPLAVAGVDSNNVVSMAYDPLDRLAARTLGDGSADASTVTYGYDVNNNITQIVDAADNDTTPGPEQTHLAYDGFDRLAEGTDRGGNVMSQSYDPSSRIVREEYRGPVDDSGGTNVLLAARDRLYDELNRPIRIDRDLFVPPGASLSVSIALVDGPLTPGDAKFSTRREYDALGRRTFVVQDDSAVYASRYDGAGRLERSTIPLVDTNSAPPMVFSNHTAYVHDKNHNLVEVTERHVSPEGLLPPADLRSIRVFDPLNRRVRTTDPDGETTYTEYDSRNNIVSAYDPRGASIADPLGLYTNGTINDFGNPVRYARDGINRGWLTTIALHEGGFGGSGIDTNNPAIPDGLIEVVAEHDANSRVARRVDGNGNATVYGYDALNRRTSRTLADGGLFTIAYDRDHNPANIVDENGTVHSFTHDGLDRRVRRDIAPAAAFIPGTFIPMLRGTTVRTFGYDGLSRLTRSLDNNEPADPADDAEVVYAYDSLSRLVQETQNGVPVASSFAADRRTDLHYSGPTGSPRVVHFTHDAHDQIIAVANQSQFKVESKYLGDCPPPICKISDDLDPVPFTALAVFQQLDEEKLVISSQVESPGAGGVVGQQQVLRDRNDSVTNQQVTLINPPLNQIDLNFNWQLSSIDQIQSHTRLQVVNGAPNQTLFQVRHGPAQEILEVTDGFNPIMQNNFSPTYERTDPPFTYNASAGTGLRTKDADHLYQYDGLNRLRSVRSAASPGDVIAAYSYDADPGIAGGRRTEKIVAHSGPLDGATRYYYDRGHVIEEYVVAGATERLARQFVYSYRHPDDLSAMDVDMNADGDPDLLFFYARDANNNITHLVDETGFTGEFYTYNLFSDPEIFSPAMTPMPFSPVGNPYLFTTRRWEPETGLYYSRARYFDPVHNEFISRDPLGIWTDGVNLGNPMAYAGNNNWNAADPSGTFTLIEQMIDITTLTIGMVGIIALDPVGIQNSKDAVEDSTSAILAESVKSAIIQSMKLKPDNEPEVPFFNFPLQDPCWPFEVPDVEVEFDFNVDPVPGGAGTPLQSFNDVFGPYRGVSTSGTTTTDLTGNSSSTIVDSTSNFLPSYLGGGTLIVNGQGFPITGNNAGTQFYMTLPIPLPPPVTPPVVKPKPKPVTPPKSKKDRWDEMQKIQQQISNIAQDEAIDKAKTQDKAVNKVNEFIGK